MRTFAVALCFGKLSWAPELNSNWTVLLEVTLDQFVLWFCLKYITVFCFSSSDAATVCWARKLFGRSCNLASLQDSAAEVHTVAACAVHSRHCWSLRWKLIWLHVKTRLGLQTRLSGSGARRTAAHLPLIIWGTLPMLSSPALHIALLSFY